MTQLIHSLPVVYRDEHLLVVNKPGGLLSVPGIGIENRDCVISRVVRKLPEAKVVHRLDCHTSGLMVLALGEWMQKSLGRMFHDREIGKEYTALVSGHVAVTQGLVDIPIRLDPQNRPYQVIDYSKGKSAQTFWRVERYLGRGSGRHTRLRLFPRTGRTHQLRVHCMAIGHPVLGDRLYADERANAMADRLMLHAERLEFIHPATGERLRLHAPCGF